MATFPDEVFGLCRPCSPPLRLCGYAFLTLNNIVNIVRGPMDQHNPFKKQIGRITNSLLFYPTFLTSSTSLTQITLTI
jgi:hypothetical protein